MVARPPHRRAAGIAGLLAVLTLPVLLALVAARPARAQVVDTLIAHAPVVARFEQARGLAVDPLGGLYVVDAGRAVLVHLTPTGRVASLLGTFGFREGQFDAPQDVDATNGLVLVVADAGNGRLQRFSRQEQVLGSLAVPRLAPGRDRLAEPGLPGRDQAPRGRPVSVAVAPSNAVFVVEAEERMVMKWDAGRRFERVFGAEADGGRLEDPVSVAALGDLVYVADRGRGAVLVYDEFGAFVRVLGEAPVRDLRAVGGRDGRLWVVAADGVRLYAPDGTLLARAAVTLGADLVDAAWVDGTLFLLTSTTLFAADVPAAE